PLPQATAQPPTPAPVGRISGSVRRAELPDSSGISLVLTRPDGTTLNIPTGAEGLFNFAGMAPGIYSLEARADGFLSSRADFTLEAGQDLTLPPVVLLAGDTNGDNIVDLTDAVMLAASFNAPPPVPEADLNRDGWIDIRDLAILGSAFGLAGPLAWE
ncbi:MAG: carboxypeptidase regulatory-like domain-containing protein, partial [Chloroflexi bacterium]|nr:carboxypeptidase regulatory-like domain-containing protein [Chloroflexota bacterium]